MPDNSLFYMVFLSQLLLISHYYPKKIHQRMRYLLDTYPAERYPKLYPEPKVTYEKGLRKYTIINHLMLGLGFILMTLYALLSAEYPANEKHAEGLPIFFGLCQFLPFMLLERSGFRQFKLMRNADKRTSRIAQLSPRHLFDFVSPALVVTAVVSFIAYVIFEFALAHFQLSAQVLTGIDRYSEYLDK